MTNNDNELQPGLHTSNENGLAINEEVEHPPLLTADEYRKRTEAAQSSIHKSLLILLGLIAFLLAIENNYSRFSDLFDETVKLRMVDAILDKEFSRIHAARSDEAHALAAINTLAEEADKSSEPYKNLAEAARKRNLDAQKRSVAPKEKRSEIEKKLSDLKKESVDLSIAGTKLPSQLSFAPTIWLMTMLCWLLYFNSRRAAVQRNLAAYHLALDKSQRSFGAAGDGSMWIVPLPRIVRLSPARGDASCVGKEDLLWLLGWSRHSEHRFQIALIVFVLITQLIIMRVVFIAYEMTSDFAIGKFSPSAWGLPGTVIPVFVAMVCSFQLLRLPFTPRDSEHFQSSAMVTRRDFLGGVVGLAFAVAAWKYRNAIFASANRQGLIRLDPYSRATTLLRHPRYISQQRRAKRLSQYQVFISAEQKVMLLYSERKRQPASGHHPNVVTLHYANKDGKVRMFSAVSTVRSMTHLSVAEADVWVKNTPKQTLSPPRHAAPSDTKTLPLNTKRTWVWEALALDRVELGDLEKACGHLIVGAELALLAPLAEPMNLRLLDLLAGLAVRTGNEGQYLTPLKVLVQARIGRLRKVRTAQDSQSVMDDPVIGRSSRSIAARPRDKLPAPSPPLPSPAVTADHVAHRNPGRFNHLNGYAEQLEQRLEKWGDQQSNWHRRWSDRTQPIWWHHPMETRQFELHRHVKSQGEQKNTETRQRPLKIA